MSWVAYERAKLDPDWQAARADLVAVVRGESADEQYRRHAAAAALMHEIEVRCEVDR